MSTTWKPAPGEKVSYRSHPDAVAEEGVVTGHSHNPAIVFVRYRGSTLVRGKATYVTDLRPVDD